MKRIIVVNPGFSIERHKHKLNEDEIIGNESWFSGSITCGMKSCPGLVSFYISNKSYREYILCGIPEKDPQKLGLFLMEVINSVEKAIQEGQDIDLRFKKEGSAAQASYGTYDKPYMNN